MAWVACPGVFNPSGGSLRQWESAFAACFGTSKVYAPVITDFTGGGNQEQPNVYAGASVYSSYPDSCSTTITKYPLAQPVIFNLTNIGQNGVINDSYIEITYTETVEYTAHTENAAFIACYGDPARTTYEANVTRDVGVSCNLYIGASNAYDCYEYTSGAPQNNLGSTTHTSVVMSNVAGTSSPQILPNGCGSVTAWIAGNVSCYDNWTSYDDFGLCGGGPPGTFTVTAYLSIASITLWVDVSGQTACPEADTGGGGNNVATIRTVTGGPSSGGNGQASVKRTMNMTGSGLGVADALIPIIENRYSPCDIRTQDLSSGDNTITWVTNSVGACIIMPSSNTTVDVKIKGASGDTGVKINKTGILQFERNTGDASFILNASASLTGVRFIYY